MLKAYGYMRVSGVGQVDGDGFTRQKKAIEQASKAKGFQIVKWFSDEGVSGTLEDRPALADLYLDLELNGHGIVTVFIEKIDRLARDLMVQESIIRMFQKKGYQLVSALEGDDLLSNDPTRQLIRRVLGAFSEYEKSMIVLKLKQARERQRKLHGKCEGRKSYAEECPDTLERLRKLRRKPKGKERLSYQAIADKMNQEGEKTLSGKAWNRHTVRTALSR